MRRCDCEKKQQWAQELKRCCVLKCATVCPQRQVARDNRFELGPSEVNDKEGTAPAPRLPCQGPVMELWGGSYAAVAPGHTEIAGDIVPVITSGLSYCHFMNWGRCPMERYVGIEEAKHRSRPHGSNEAKRRFAS